MIILSGDIGGTKTNLALFATDNGAPGQTIAEQSFASAQYDSLEACLREFLAGRKERPTHAAFGVAGPVVDDRVATPNLPWIIEASSLAHLLDVECVRLVNDLEAMALGIEALGPDQLHVVNEGDPTRGGNRGLIAAGTGCGMAGILWHRGGYVPVPSEGGHIDFAPRNSTESELLAYLRNQYGHVSYERIISGPGLSNVYSFLCDTGHHAESDWLVEEMENGDAAAAISKAALAGSCPLARKALDLFVSIYGAMAGNLALMFVATGGLYVGGGIAPKILDKIVDGSFMEAFVAKGRFRELLESMPVRVILDDKAGLYGAAIAAAEK
jgi:glucokinase